jgi:hypothetical protein
VVEVPAEILCDLSFEPLHVRAGTEGAEDHLCARPDFILKIREDEWTASYVYQLHQGSQSTTQGLKRRSADILPVHIGLRLKYQLHLGSHHWNVVQLFKKRQSILDALPQSAESTLTAQQR